MDVFFSETRCICEILLWYIVHSVKPAVEKSPLVIPLIQQNRWLNARKPEDLETDDSDRHEKTVVKIAAIERTGDKVTDTAVREILNGNGSLSSAKSWMHNCRMFDSIGQTYSTKGHTQM